MFRVGGAARASSPSFLLRSGDGERSGESLPFPVSAPAAALPFPVAAAAERTTALPLDAAAEMTEGPLATRGEPRSVEWPYKKKETKSDKEFKGVEGGRRSPFRDFRFSLRFFSRRVDVV